VKEISALLRRISSGDNTALSELRDALKAKGWLDANTEILIDSLEVNQNPYVLKTLISSVQELLGRITDGEISPFKQPDVDIDGPIRFGLTESGRFCGFSPGEGHCLIAGQTLSGKTTLLFIIFAQALLKGIRCWLFVKSKEVRNFLKLTPEIVIVDFKSGIKINPLLPPPGLSKSEWTNVFSEVFIQGFKIFEGTQNFIIKLLNELPDNSNLFDLLRKVESTKCPPGSRTVHYKESAINRLGGILSGDWAQTFNCAESDLESLAERNVIFEIGNLTDDQQKFIPNVLTTWLFKYRSKKGENAEVEELPEPTRPFELVPRELIRARMPIHFIGLDDANLLFSKGEEGFYSLTIIDNLLATVRHGRIFVFCCTHMPHRLGAGIKSNAFMQIMFALANSDDVRCMQGSMGIYDKEMREYNLNFEKREMIVKFSKRYNEPFLARVPEFHLPEGTISDKEAYENNERIFGIREKTAERKESQETAARKERQKKEERERTEPKPEETAFLWDIYNRAYVSIKERYDTLKLSASKGDRIADSLVRKGLCRKHKINLGYRGGMTTFLELTREGYEAIGVPVREHLSRGGGFEHDLWISKISEHLKALRSDWVVSVEKQLKGKFIDIMIEFQNKIIGLEVALTPVHEKTNLEKDFGQCACDYVIVACKDDKVLKEVKKIAQDLNEEKRSKVGVCLLHELLRCKSLDEILNPNLSGGEKNERRVD